MLDNEFTPGNATLIAHNCVIKTLGNNYPLSPSQTLKQYGVFTGEQILIIREDIREHNTYGLPKYRRSIDPNALIDLSTNWTINKLSDVIYEQSYPVELRAPSYTGKELSSNRLAGSELRHPLETIVVSFAVGMIVGFFLGRSNRYL